MVLFIITVNERLEKNITVFCTPLRSHAFMHFAEKHPLLLYNAQMFVLLLQHNKTWGQGSDKKVTADRSASMPLIACTVKTNFFFF